MFEALGRARILCIMFCNKINVVIFQFDCLFVNQRHPRGKSHWAWSNIPSMCTLACVVMSNGLNTFLSAWWLSDISCFDILITFIQMKMQIPRSRTRFMSSIIFASNLSRDGEYTNHIFEHEDVTFAAKNQSRDGSTSEYSEYLFLFSQKCIEASVYSLLILCNIFERRKRIMEKHK